MPLKRCILKDIDSLPRFYDAIARQLELPTHFGRNLDALWDTLSGDVEGPIEVVWEDAARARAALGKEYERVATLLRDVAREREDFHFIEQ